MGKPPLNQLWSEGLVSALADAGVRVAVIAPGSRSTPLVMALQADGRFRCVVHIDERSAGFFALGAAKATGMPAAVLTTSGTATANLLPAIVEAAASETPMVVLTADRPQHLRNADANQTIDQLGLYGSYVRFFADVPAPAPGEAFLRHARHLVARAVASARGPDRGPVHLNVPFDKPLEPGPDKGPAPPHAPRVTNAVPGLEASEVDRLLDAWRQARRGLIVAGPQPAGPGAGEAVRRIARATGFPLLADPLSGARFRGDQDGALVVATYDVALDPSSAVGKLRPELVLRFGAAPTSQNLLRFLQELRDVPQTVIDGGGRWKDHLSIASEYVRCDPRWLSKQVDASLTSSCAPEEWRRLWRSLERRARTALSEELVGDAFEGRIVREAVAAVPDGGSVFVSSSMPVRDLDAFAVDSARRLAVIGNRGASGIDGVVSSALGAAMQMPGGSNLAVVGDLALFHDANGLLAAREGIDLVILVIQNDGGGIFHMLPIREHEPAFTEFFATPHGLDFRHIADLYHLPFQRVEPADVGRAVADALGRGGCRIIEVASDREGNQERRSQVVAGVQRRLWGSR